MSSEEPRTIEEIAADYKLPIDAVKEAIAYCESNPPELLEDYRREKALIKAAGMDLPRHAGGGQGSHLTPEEIARIRREAAEA